jgi:G3E family GTPase
VFTSFGRETTNKYTKEEIENILSEFDEMSVGTVLRSKGIVEGVNGEWIHFDYVPGEVDVRVSTAEVIGKICVIGSQLDNEKIEKLFRL